MTKRIMSDVKGFLATVTTAAATIVAWLPWIEAALRIGVSIAGIVAAYYAASYWRAKRRKVNEERE